jgi:hypothetical protein
MSDELPDNVVSIFWWKYKRLKIPAKPELTIEQKLAAALAKWGSFKRD